MLIPKGALINVEWHDGQRNSYQVAEDSVDGDVTAHRYIERRNGFAPWTAKVPRKFIQEVLPPLTK